MIFILVVLASVTLFVGWLKWTYSYWERKKVPGPKPSMFVGNIGPTLSFSKHWGVITSDWYKTYADAPYIGYYKMMQPAILLRDADIIKDVLMKDFFSFRYNDSKLSEKYDPLFATNPFFVRDDKWKESRKTILPAFSPSKIKNIIPVINSVGEELVDFIKSYPENADFDAKNLSVRFTTQNVMQCGFSIDADCFNKTKESEFLKAGRKIFEPSFMAGLKFLALPILPKWALDLIPIPFLPEFTNRLFRRFVAQNRASRPEDCQNNDFFQMFLQTQQKHNFPDIFLIGHSLSLFGDGTETSSTAMSYALYDLAINPECQERLYNDIVEVLNKHDDKMCSDALQEMNYLEWVLLESMRIHPALMVMGKICTEEYVLPPVSKNSKPIKIYPGTAVHIPVQAIHMDPKHYPNPEEFIPERFTEEEQRNRHNAIYLPFGEGPRICVGMRFATAQIKSGLAYIVRNFHVKLSPNHKPIVIDPQTLLSYPTHGIMIKLMPR